MDGAHCVGWKKQCSHAALIWVRRGGCACVRVDERCHNAAAAVVFPAHDHTAMLHTHVTHACPAVGTYMCQ